MEFEPNGDSVVVSPFPLKMNDSEVILAPTVQLVFQCGTIEAVGPYVRNLKVGQVVLYQASPRFLNLPTTLGAGKIIPEEDISGVVREPVSDAPGV